MPVALDRAGEPRRVPAVVDRGAYRVVRDALARRPQATGGLGRDRVHARRAGRAGRRRRLRLARLEELAELAAALGGGLTAAPAPGRLSGCGRGCRPKASRRLPQRRSQRVERRPPRAAVADRAEHGARQRGLGDVAGDGRTARGPGRTRSGSSVTACPFATSASSISRSLERWRTSGSNPPSARQARIVSSP